MLLLRRILAVEIHHVCAAAKNSADLMLLQRMVKFMHFFGTPGTTLVLISGDINYLPFVLDFKIRNLMNIIVIHRSSSVNKELLDIADRNIAWSEILANIPSRIPSSQKEDEAMLTVRGLPKVPPKLLKDRLSMMVDASGGKIQNLNIKQRTAVVKFKTQESASRAEKRLQNQKLFKKVIEVSSQSEADIEKPQQEDIKKDEKKSFYEELTKSSVKRALKIFRKDTNSESSTPAAPPEVNEQLGGTSLYPVEDTDEDLYSEETNQPPSLSGQEQIEADVVPSKPEVSKTKPEEPESLPQDSRKRKKMD